MEYYWIGWCREDNHDKVWGLIDLTNGKYRGDYIAFWGRRGKKLQTKIHRNLSYYDAQKLCEKKEDGGYRTIKTLTDVYPEFEEDLEKTAVWSMLKA